MSEDRTDPQGSLHSSPGGPVAWNSPLGLNGGGAWQHRAELQREGGGSRLQEGTARTTEEGCLEDMFSDEGLRRARGRVFGLHFAGGEAEAQKMFCL